MKLHVSAVFLLIVLIYVSDVCCVWISFADFLKYDYEPNTANIIRAKDNCPADTVQIIPGDCRPIIKVIYSLY